MIKETQRLNKLSLAIAKLQLKYKDNSFSLRVLNRYFNKLIELKEIKQQLETRLKLS